MDEHLGHQKYAKSSSGNYRNGTTKKTVKSKHGEFELETPRDRNATFVPQIMRKRQTVIAEGIDNKILSLYALGMSYRDIKNHMNELYGFELSPSMMTSITDRVIPDLREWKARHLEPVYPFIWMDAIHYKVKQDAKIITKAVNVIIGINMDGKKDVLGFYLSENESAAFWLSVLTDLSNRGVKDILIACIDNLSGFAGAIESLFPKTEVQLCIVHQIRNSLKYIASRDQKAFMKDLKQVYQATNKEIAEQKLTELDENWGVKYPLVLKSWSNNWERLSNYFKYSQDIRKIIYTTNTVESFHRQLRKFTKTKSVFSTDTALEKILYLVMSNITKKWTLPVRNWGLTLSQLSILFEERLDIDLRI
jgi:transposase-like protein